MKLAQIEQIDVLDTVRQFFVRRRRARRVQVIRDNADVAFFENVNRERSAQRRFATIFGPNFEDVPEWQRRLAYQALSDYEDDYDVVLGMPLRRF